MFERPASGERAVVVQLDLGQDAIEERLSEVSLLAASAGAVVVAVIGGRRAAPDPALFAGRGKVDEIGQTLRAHEADLVIFNHALSPAQQRNLEHTLECRVVDRTALILDIFALRAKSHEGKLQVELAQLSHLATRLVRGWTHLERQKGGIGLRGPGEKQLETDRRLLGARVKLLKTRLGQLEKQRRTRRRARNRREMLSVSLVGYTNAGKSTLFNALTKAGSYAADQLFATLDTTSRRLYVGSGNNVVISDTVGFIRDLPHALVVAFHATLEETAQADLLLHVVDVASEDREAQIASVNDVLHEIGAASVPQIQVWNKIDLTQAGPAVVQDSYGRIERIFLSARTGEGLDLLRAALAEVAEVARAGSGAGDAAQDSIPSLVTDAGSDPDFAFAPAAGSDLGVG
ncbi:GTPase HflX [Betaproteobacteria bacterium]|nr:GTPase HflX [Betaproteobacteria bacterium]GHU15007.1 GTPase HflX [Betaproteobacteria bacterium]GHU22698.1 GTPase HflX [Betaproteobacteria bacterium]